MKGLRSFLGILLCLSGIALANEVEADTIPPDNNKKVTLKEVVVETTNRKIIPGGGIAFYPDKREKKFAVDAMTLLEGMALTELPYDVRNRTITDASGNAVNFYIDGQPASSKEMSAMNPKDVDRIEYFRISTDAHFQGKNNVVNFIMKKYLSGGFTKTDLKQGLDGRLGTYSIASKLAYKEMTYDVYLTGNYRIDNHIGTESSTEYRDFVYNGKEHTSLSENIKSRDNHLRKNSLGAYLKAAWSHRNLSLNATGGWNWERLPYMRGSAMTKYSPDIFDSNGYFSNQSSMGVNPYLTLSLFLMMPKNQSLSVFLNGNYAYHNSSSIREQENLPIIDNGNKDKRAAGYLSIGYSRNFNSRNTLNLSLGSGLDWNKSKYAGSYAGISNYHGSNISFSASFTHTFRPGTSLSASAGFSWEHQKTLDKKRDLWNPSGNLSLSHKWNNKSSMRLSTNLFSYGYTMNVFNEVIQRQTELLWVKGNTNLRNRLMWQTAFNNTWNTSRNFSITPSIVYTAIFHHDMPVWERIAGYDGLVRSITDNSTVHRLTIGPRATLRLFNRKLVLTGSAEYTYLAISGIYDRKGSFYQGSLTATWYGNNWYVGASLVPSTAVSTYDDIYREYKTWVYNIRAGYTYKDLNIRFTAYSPFLSDLQSTRKVDTPHFSQRESSYSGFRSNVFTLQLVYTISYGKKVSRSVSSGSQMLSSGTLALPD